MKIYTYITTLFIGLLIGGIAVYQYDTIYYNMIPKDSDVAIIYPDMEANQIDEQLNKLVETVPTPQDIQRLLVAHGADLHIDGVIGAETIKAWEAHCSGQ
jgi:Ni,Fe-hydrogenase III small subunit